MMSPESHFNRDIYLINEHGELDFSASSQFPQRTEDKRIAGNNGNFQTLRHSHGSSENGLDHLVTIYKNDFEASLKEVVKEFPEIDPTKITSLDDLAEQLKAQGQHLRKQFAETQTKKANDIDSHSENAGLVS